MWAKISLAICTYLITTGSLLDRGMWPGQTVDLVRVEKSQRQLQLIGGGQILRRYSIALGGDPVGHKHRKGDGRTPEGRYVLQAASS